MPDYILAVLPGVIAGVLSAIGSMGAVKAVLKELLHRVTRLEKISLENQRALGRLEGKNAQIEEVLKCSY
jgi:hypothetical protein